MSEARYGNLPSVNELNVTSELYEICVARYDPCIFVKKIINYCWYFFYFFGQSILIQLFFT